MADLNYAMTHREIGFVLGLSRERVRQIEEKALAKLRRQGISQQMLDLLHDKDSVRTYARAVRTGEVSR